MRTVVTPRIAQQAGVQRELLWALAERPYPSVKALVDRIGRNRASTSRALHRLVDMGLVGRTNGGWSATDEGRKQASDARGVTDVVTRAARQQARVGRFTTADPDLYPRHMRGIVEGVGRFAAYADSVKSFARFADQIAAQESAVSKIAAHESAASSIFSKIAAMNVGAGRASKIALEELAAGGIASKVLASFGRELVSGALEQGIAGIRAKALEDVAADFMRVRLAALDAVRIESQVANLGLGIGSHWAALMSQHLNLTSQVAANIAATADLAPLIPGLGPEVWRGVARVGRAHNVHLGRMIGSLPVGPTAPDPGLSHRLVRPSVAVAGFTSAGRAMLDPTIERGEADWWLEIGSMLDDLGARGAATAWRGSWERLREGGTDWERACAHGGREALRLCLEALGRPKDGDAKPTRRDHIAYIVGPSKSTIELTAALYGNWDVLYQGLSAVAHANDKEARRNHVLALLEAAGAVLRLLSDYARTRTGSAGRRG